MNRLNKSIPALNNEHYWGLTLGQIHMGEGSLDWTTCCVPRVKRATVPITLLLKIPGGRQVHTGSEYSSPFQRPSWRSPERGEEALRNHIRVFCSVLTYLLCPSTFSSCFIFIISDISSQRWINLGFAPQPALSDNLSSIPCTLWGSLTLPVTRASFWNYIPRVAL